MLIEAAGAQRDGSSSRWSTRCSRWPVQRQLKQEFGFRTVDAGVRSVYAPSNADLVGETVMLTGDLNVAVVEWIVQYRVSNPSEYLFKVRNLEATFHAMNEAVMREVVGDRYCQVKRNRAD